jgi:hypothetical protein
VFWGATALTVTLRPALLIEPSPVLIEALSAA